MVSKSDAWEFDVVRDGGCSAAFPKLYSDVDEMVSRRKDYRIAKADKDSVGGGAPDICQQSDDTQWRTVHHICRRTRCLSVARFCDIACDKPCKWWPNPTELDSPNCEFRVYVGDLAGQITNNDTLWVHTKHIESDADLSWLMSDCGMYDWPEAMIRSDSKPPCDTKAIEEQVP